MTGSRGPNRGTAGRPFLALGDPIPPLASGIIAAIVQPEKPIATSEGIDIPTVRCPTSSRPLSVETSGLQEPFRAWPWSGSSLDGPITVDSPEVNTALSKLPALHPVAPRRLQEPSNPSDMGLDCPPQRHGPPASPPAQAAAQLASLTRRLVALAPATEPSSQTWNSKLEIHNGGSQFEYQAKLVECQAGAGMLPAGSTGRPALTTDNAVKSFDDPSWPTPPTRGHTLSRAGTEDSDMGKEPSQLPSITPPSAGAELGRSAHLGTPVEKHREHLRPSMSRQQATIWAR
ncbi:hypothetical protein G7046_g7837 [Stylonectria norvegica]|nr:hypothetical protein G7046_g7837 [Stylonectria norvegica]